MASVPAKPLISLPFEVPPVGAFQQVSKKRAKLVPADGLTIKRHVNDVSLELTVNEINFHLISRLFRGNLGIRANERRLAYCCHRSLIL